MQKIKAFNLVDTNVFVEYLRGHDRAVDFIHSTAAIIISSVTVAELIVGCRTKHELSLLDRALLPYRIIEISEPISKLALEYLRLSKFNYGAEYLDCIIAATAATHQLPLYTLNTRHYKHFDIDVFRPY